MLWYKTSHPKKPLTFAGFEPPIWLSLFTKLIFPKVVEIFSRKASSLLHGTTGMFSGGALKRVSRFTILRNSKKKYTKNPTEELIKYKAKFHILQYNNYCRSHRNNHFKLSVHNQFYASPIHNSIKQFY